MLAMLLATTIAVVFAVDPALGHPGPVSPKDGCHVCRKNCEKWGIPPGRHCHPERLAEARAAAKQTTKTSKKPKKAKAPKVDKFAGKKAYVDKVVDGDTLAVRVNGQKVRIRLYGIDCPESHKNAKCDKEGKAGGLTCAEQIPLGLRAARRAAQLAKHQYVTLEGPTETDFYKRTLAYVRLPDGRDLGLLLLQEGLCDDYTWKYPHPRGENGQYER